jgi:hypothetical protein
MKKCIAGLLLLGVNSVSWADEADELVLYCVYKASASINGGEAISTEITIKNTFRINADYLNSDSTFALPVVQKSEKLIVAQDSYYVPGDMFSETYTFSLTASGFKTVHSVTRETDGFISYGTCTKF